MAKQRKLPAAHQLTLDVPNEDAGPYIRATLGTIHPPVVDELRCLSELQESQHVLRQLTARDWAFTDAATGYYSHGLHPYPAKFIPQIPRQLIASLTTRGELVWDPFGGSGTTALEAVLLGRRAWSTDLNPVAKVIGEGKLAVLGLNGGQETGRLAQRLTLIIASETNLADALSRHRGEIEANTPTIPNREKWFHAQAERELAYIRWEVERLKDSGARALALATF